MGVRGHTEGTPTTKGQKRWGGGLEIAKDRQEENQEKHPWCPVEGRGGEQAGLLGSGVGGWACWGPSSTEHYRGRTLGLQRSREEVCQGAAPSPELGRVSQGPGWEGMGGPPGRGSRRGAQGQERGM